MSKAEHIDIDSRLEFLRYNRLDRTALKDISSILETEIPNILDKFYAFAQRQPELQRILEGQEISRLKNAQHSYWLNLFLDELDGAFVRRATKVGEAHARVGLSPSWYIASYAFILMELNSTLIDRYKDQPDDLNAVLAAVVKCMFLDMDLTTSIFIDRANEKSRQDTLRIADLLDQRIGEAIKVMQNRNAEVRNASDLVSTATGNVDALANAVAAAAEEAKVSVDSNAATTEEMTASVQEISVQVQNAQITTKDAVDRSDQAKTDIQHLSNSARQISEIVDLISNIAGQTNLLALNATIEAARAGDAGKGFAVVAQEVKALASQTQSATKEITAQINAIQKSVDDVVVSITGVSTVIDQIDETSASIAAALEEQSAAASEIGRSSSEAAQGTHEVTVNITEVAKEANTTRETTDTLSALIGESIEQADTLRDEVGVVLEELRAARL